MIKNHMTLFMMLLVTLAGIPMVQAQEGKTREAPVEVAQAQQAPAECSPTPRDAMGPYYEPDAPMRSRVGEGYTLSGVVRSAGDCSALEGAMIELWMTGPDGRYADEYRARMRSGENGNYRFESHMPGAYGSRPPHIHIRVTAPGHEPLVTQHYPEENSSAGTMNLVLREDG